MNKAEMHRKRSKLLPRISSLALKTHLNMRGANPIPSTLSHGELRKKMRRLSQSFCVRCLDSSGFSAKDGILFGLRTLKHPFAKAH